MVVVVATPPRSSASSFFFSWWRTLSYFVVAVAVAAAASPLLGAMTAKNSDWSAADPQTTQVVVVPRIGSKWVTRQHGKNGFVINDVDKTDEQHSLAFGDANSRVL